MMVVHSNHQSTEAVAGNAAYADNAAHAGNAAYAGNAARLLPGGIAF